MLLGKRSPWKNNVSPWKVLEPCTRALSVLSNDFSQEFQDLKQQYHSGTASLKLCPCLSVVLSALFLFFFSDLSNKSHLKVLESRPFQNGPVSLPVSSPTAVHTGAQVTSTPLPNHSFVPPANAIHSGGGNIKYSRTTKVTRQASGGPRITTVTRVVNNGEKENSATHTTASDQEGMSLMDKKKVPLPGLGTTLNPRRYWHIVVFYLIVFTKWKYFEAAWHYLSLIIRVQCL